MVADQQRKRVLPLVAVLVVALAVVASQVLDGPGSEPETTPTPERAVAFAGDPAAVERGSQIFAGQCASCHGAAGKGDGPAAAELNPKPVDFTNPMHLMHANADFVRWITEGVPGSQMPAFGGTLTPAQIDDVVLFIRSLQASELANRDVDVPDPSECTIEPRPPESFMPEGTIVPKPAPTSLPDVGTGFAWPQGEPAADDEIAGITQTIREFHACANAGDYPRRLALYTDRTIRPQFDALDEAGWASTLAFAATPAAVVPEGQRGWIDSITMARRLPDGRVGAYIVVIDPVNHPHQINAVVIFAQERGRWLIDEVHQDPGGALVATVTPTSASSAPVAGLNTPVTSAGLVVTLLEAPFSYGVQDLMLEVKDTRGEAVTGLRVVFYVDMPDMAMGIQEITAAEEEGGRYRATVPVGMPGPWQAIATIELDDGRDVAFSFPFTIDY